MNIGLRIQILNQLVESQLDDENIREICVDKKLLAVLIDLAENEIGERLGTSADVSKLTVEEYFHS